MLFFFFFQAEDGIRDYKVTGVQTCALPIYQKARDALVQQLESLRNQVLSYANAKDSNGLPIDRKSTRLNSSHLVISYAVFCLKKKKHHRLEKTHPIQTALQHKSHTPSSMYY